MFGSSGGNSPALRCLREARAGRSSSLSQRFTRKTTSPERVSCTPVRAVTSSEYLWPRFETWGIRPHHGSPPRRRIRYARCFVTTRALVVWRIVSASNSSRAVYGIPASSLMLTG